jgi:hypothetical protein
MTWTFYTAQGEEKQASFPANANVSFGGYKAVLLANPTNNQDAVTKAYADTIVDDSIPLGVYIAGQTASYVGGGTWVTASGQSTPVGNPAGNVSVVTWTVPATGWYRIDLWARLDNGSAGKQVGIRPNRNGSAIDTGGTMRSYNGVAAMYAAAAGFLAMQLTGGDTIKPEVMHDDTASRTVSWRMAIQELIDYS